VESASEARLLSISPAEPKWQQEGDDAKKLPQEHESALNGWMLKHPWLPWRLHASDCDVLRPPQTAVAAEKNFMWEYTMSKAWSWIMIAMSWPDQVFSAPSLEANGPPKANTMATSIIQNEIDHLKHTICRVERPANPIQMHSETKKDKQRPAPYRDISGLPASLSSKLE
jgi:hypothetical protein